jgi:PAS domain-containing protein
MLHDFRKMLATVGERLKVGDGAAVNVASRDFFIRQRDHHDAGLVVSKAIVSRTTGKWQIALTRRLNQPDGSFAGMAVALIELDKITAKFATLNIGPHGFIVLRDLDLYLLVRYTGLKQNEQKFRTLIESSPYPLVIADANGLIVLANRQVMTLFGYEPEELVIAKLDRLARNVQSRGCVFCRSLIWWLGGRQCQTRSQHGDATRVAMVHAA